MDKVQNPPKTNNRLNPKQERFIQAYIDKNSDTYSNQTRSYQEAYGTDNYYVAASNANRLLKQEKVQNRIEQLFNENGFNDEVAIQSLARIATGHYKKKTQTTHTDKDGEVVGKSTVVSTPSSRDVIQAIDLRAKLTGHYKQQDIDKEQALDEMKALRRKMMRELNKAVEVNSGDTGDAVEGLRGTDTPSS